MICNKIYFRNKQYLINNDNGVLIFEKVNNHVHRRVRRIMDYILISDIINIITWYTNDIHEVEYNTDTQVIKLTNTSLDINYSIHISPNVEDYRMISRKWIYDDIIMVTITNYHNAGYYFQKSNINDNPYHFYQQYMRSYPYVNSTLTYIKLLQNLREYNLYRVSYKIKDHKKLKHHIIILQMIYDTVRKKFNM